MNVGVTSSTNCQLLHDHAVSRCLVWKEYLAAVLQAVRTAEIAMQGVMRSSAPGSIFSGDRLWGRQARPPAQASSAGEGEADEDSRHLRRRLLGAVPGPSNHRIPGVAVQRFIIK